MSLSFNNVTKMVMVNFAQRFHLYIHAYALLLQQRGLTLLEIGAIESVVIASVFLLEVPTGVIADRIGRKWSVVASTFFMMCGETLFIFAETYPVYLLIALLTGTGFAFASGAVESLVYDSLPLENRDDLMKQAMGRVGGWGQIAFFIAPIFGAIIIGDATPPRFTLAITLTATALFIGLLISLTLKEPQSDWQAEKPNSLAIFRDGLAEIRGNRLLQRFILLIMFTCTFTGALVVTLGAPYMHSHQVSPFMIGMALSLGSLFGAFTQRYAYLLEKWFGSGLTIFVLTIMPGIFYWILASATGGIIVWFLIVWMYGTNDMKAPIFSAYQNALIVSKNRATVLSLISMCVTLYIAIMSPIYAGIATQSLPLAFVLIGSVIVLAVFLLRVDRFDTSKRKNSD